MNIAEIGGFQVLLLPWGATMNTDINSRIINIREETIGNTTFIVTSEYSENATETVEQKLERIIRRHATDIYKPQK
jgi:hypothetical protein